jgi:hypothetical protein
LLTACSLSAKKWDWEYWQYVNWTHWHCGPQKLYVLGEVRFDKDFSSFYYCRIAENYAYTPMPNLDMEAHYSYIYYKPHGTTKFVHTNRLELELNPIIILKDGIFVQCRNRLDILKRQSVNHIQFVYRQRTMFVFPVENYGKLTAVRIYDEVFYDFDNSKFTQNRFVPIEVVFDLNEKCNLSAFFAVRNFFSFSENKWLNSFVLSSQLSF